MLASLVVMGACSSETMVSESATGEAADEAAATTAAPLADAAPGALPPQVYEPGVTDDTTFDDAGDTGFVPTSTDPQSTFGMDVDTGSYTVGRRLISEGYLPPADSVRPEEWINAFDYDDPVPTDDDFSITTTVGAAPFTDDGTLLARIGLQTRTIPDEDRPPAALTWVIDTSGSMDIRERLGLVKESLELLVESLDDDDTIAIVTYGNDSRPQLEPTPVSDADAIYDAIDELEAGGGTNMEAGLLLGYDQAREAYRDDAVNAVILASDGVANIGLDEGEPLADRIREEGNDGIHLVTVGFGMGNYNDALMEQLADTGDGMYAYVDTIDEAERLFVEDLTPTLTPVAGDAKVQVSFDADVVASYRLIGYENRALADEDFTDDTVDAGELGAGHAVTALYEIRLHDGVDPGSDPALGDVSIRWESVADGEVHQLDETLSTAGDAETDPAWMLASTVGLTSEVLRGNADVSGRRITLDMVRERAEDLPGDQGDELRQLLDDASEAEPY
ncbi:MAG: von Willebrand factor type A domain-containing protein [Acidimicrobiales bacterium]